MSESDHSTEKKDPKACAICDREKVAEGLCKYHYQAHQNVMKYYDDWKKGYGELSFSDYLQKIIDNDATGIWAKEVAELLQKKEISNNE